MPHRDLYRAGRPCIDQIGVDHQKADDRTEEGVAAKDTGSADSNQNRQERKRGVGNHIKETVPVGTGKAGDGLAKGLHQAHHQAGGDDCGENGDEYVSGNLQQFLPPRHLGGGSGLDIVLGGGSHAGDVQEFIIHLIDGSGADDDLDLTVALENALDAIHIFQRFLVDLAVVHRHQTESGSTVSRTDQVVSSAQLVKDLLRTLAVVHGFPPFLK